MAYLNNEAGEYVGLIVQDAAGVPSMPTDFKWIDDGFSKRIAWVDGTNTYK